MALTPDEVDAEAVEAVTARGERRTDRRATRARASGRRSGTVVRRARSGVVLIALLGVVGCGSDAGQVGATVARSPACPGLAAAFAGGGRTGSERRSPEDVRRAVIGALGRSGSPRGTGAPWVHRFSGSWSEEDLEAASRWFLVECVGPTVIDRPEDRRLLPSPAPAELPLCFAMDTAELAATVILPRPQPRPGHSALWGDAARPDPWSGPVVSLSTERRNRVPVHEGATPASVGGRPALVAPAALFQAVSSAAWGHVVSWQERPGLVAEVAWRGRSPADVVQLAGRVRFVGDRPVLPSDALGARTAPLFDGSAPTPLGLLGGLWTAVYGVGEESFQVHGHRSADGALDALEYWSVHSEPVAIDQEEAILYAAFDAERGPWGVIWDEGDGLTVQVVGFAGRDEVVAFASSLEDVTAAGWRAAKANAQRCDESP